MREFDLEMMMTINIFEKITGVGVKDCIKNETIYFLVNKGSVGKAIGKKGEKIKTVENKFKKHIKVFEWAEDDKTLLNNMIPQAQKITITDGKAIVNIKTKDRGAVIGVSGSNINAIRELALRNSKVKEIKIV